MERRSHCIAVFEKRKSMLRKIILQIAACNAQKFGPGISLAGPELMMCSHILSQFVFDKKFYEVGFGIDWIHLLSHAGNLTRYRFQSSLLNATPNVHVSYTPSLFSKMRLRAISNFSVTSKLYSVPNFTRKKFL